MLRAVDLLSFLRRVHRFSTASHPTALDACYLAACPLPGSDFHRLADDSFQDTQRGVGRLPIFLDYAVTQQKLGFAPKHLKVQEVD